MFGLKDHVSNLQYSQRFYYSNYEYYNDYDNPKDYSNDITKVFYSCKRKSTPVITKFHRLPFQAQQSRKIRSDSQQQLTMEQLIDVFITKFQNLNYSDYLDNIQQTNKNTFRIKYFLGDTSTRNSKNVIQRKNKFGIQIDSLQILDVLIDILKETRQHIINLNTNQQISNQDFAYQQKKLAFTELAEKALIAQLKKEEEGTKTRHNFHIFRAMVQDILNSILDAETCSHQILYMPNIPVFSYFINPALCIAKNFIIKQQSRSKSQSASSEAFYRQVPKIAFINLEGKEHPLNLQYLRASYTHSLLYITIYKQLEQSNQAYDQISLFYSKFLASLINECNNQAKKQKVYHEKPNFFGPSKILAFPLNPAYLRPEPQQLYSPKQKQFSPLYGSSSDITFLFQNAIYQQIRLLSPNIIFISYNNQLEIQQSHFNQIIRRLTILSDHKIILFPNLSNLLEKRHYLSEIIQSSMQKQQSDTDQIKYFSQEDELQNMAQFLEDYIFYELKDININLLFNNLGMFNKIVSGAYSLQQKRQIKPTEKFQVGAKYDYLKGLANLPEFSYMQKYCSKNFSSGPLGKLLFIQQEKLLQANKQQVQFLQSFINKALQSILINKEQLPAHLRIKFEKLCLNSKSSNKNIEQEMEAKKKSILIETITRQKVKKIFTKNKTIPINNSDKSNFNDIMALELYFINKQGNKEKIMLDNFSQAFIDPTNSMVFCLNYLDCRFKLYWMFGLINKHKSSPICQQKQNHIQIKEVQMYPLKEESMSEKQVLEFQYSQCFDKVSQKLYLYWPYAWNCLEQAAHLLLDLKYQPPRIHKILVINYKLETGEVCEMQQFSHNPQSVPKVLPRYGSTMYPQNQSEMYIFGGYYNTKQDFYSNSTGVSFVKIQGNVLNITDIPKSKLGNKLRPKANYGLKRMNQHEIILEGGFGKQFTNFYNVYSYQQYRFNLNTHKLVTQKTQRYINLLSTPIRSSNSSKYQSFSFSKKPNPSSIQQVSKPSTISLASKYKFIFASQQPDFKPRSFMTDQYAINTHKEAQNSKILFEINKSIQGIYRTGKHSPELYVRKKQSCVVDRIQMLATVDEMKQWIVKKEIMPSEDSIISVCINDSGTTLFMLVYSEIYTNSQYTIYKQTLSNVTNKPSINEAPFQNSLSFTKFYEFNSNKNSNLKHKTLYCVNDKIVLVGGEECAITGNPKYGYREDYVIQEVRGVMKIDFIKMKYVKSNQGQDYLLDLVNCYAIDAPGIEGAILLYAIQMNEEYRWLLKIQQTSLMNGIHFIRVSQLTTCTVLGHTMYQINPSFCQPEFTSIQRYNIVPFFTLQNYYQSLVQCLLQISRLQKQCEGLYLSDLNLLKQLIGQAFNQQEEHIRQNLQQLYKKTKQFAKSVLHKDRYEQHQEIKQLANETLALILTLIIQDVCLRFVDTPQVKQLYRFYVEDARQKLVKYIAIGELGSNCLVFFRLKFSKPVALCMKNFSQVPNLLYGCNLIDNQVNIIRFKNQKFAKHYMNEEDQISVDISQISPFEPEIEEYEISNQISNESQISNLNQEVTNINLDAIQ